MLARSFRMFVTMVGFVACANAFGADLGTSRPAVKYVIPDGYVGWLRIDYGVSESRAMQYGLTRILPLLVENGAVVAQFPPSGYLVTSSRMEDGWAKDEYFYSANGVRKPLSQAHDTGMVWDKVNGSNYTIFFIGTSADYQKYGSRHDPQPRPGPVVR
jgi:hypothetical protein